MGVSSFSLIPFHLLSFHLTRVPSHLKPFLAISSYLDCPVESQVLKVRVAYTQISQLQAQAGVYKGCFPFLMGSRDGVFMFSTSSNLPLVAEASTLSLPTSMD